eukprot:5489320-Lingulodinium_polyedra.AAC.1
MTESLARHIKTWNWQQLRAMLQLKRAPWDEGRRGHCIRTSVWLARLRSQLGIDDLLARVLTRYHSVAVRIAEAP